MNDLIKVINDNRNSINENICNDLIDLINNHNILDEDSLKTYEDKYFSTSNLLDRINSCYNEYKSDTTHFDYLDSSDIVMLDKYSKSLEEESNPLIKCKYLILLYDLLEWQLYFPYEAFELIKNKEL